MQPGPGWRCVNRFSMSRRVCVNSLSWHSDYAAGSFCWQHEWGGSVTHNAHSSEDDKHRSLHLKTLNIPEHLWILERSAWRRWTVQPLERFKPHFSAQLLWLIYSLNDVTWIWMISFVQWNVLLKILEKTLLLENWSVFFMVLKVPFRECAFVLGVTASVDCGWMFCLINAEQDGSVHSEGPLSSMRKLSLRNRCLGSLWIAASTAFSAFVFLRVRSSEAGGYETDADGSMLRKSCICFWRDSEVKCASTKGNFKGWNNVLFYKL